MKPLPEFCQRRVQAWERKAHLVPTREGNFRVRMAGKGCLTLWGAGSLAWLGGALLEMLCEPPALQVGPCVLPAELMEWPQSSQTTLLESPILKSRVVLFVMLGLGCWEAVVQVCW